MTATTNQSEIPAPADQLEQCNAYLRRQLKPREGHPPAVGRRPPGPAVTIAYQTGSGEHAVARKLAEILPVDERESPAPWTVFDRRLVEVVLDDHHLPRRLARYMPEDRRSYLQDVMEELVGLRPPSWVMVPQIAETILNLASLGHVILVGRGANFITARLSNMFHVRLIGELDTRIQRVMVAHEWAREQALEFIEREDKAHGRYARTHFHGEPEDELRYHLVVDTDRIPPEDAAELIAHGAGRVFAREGLPLAQS